MLKHINKKKYKKITNIQQKNFTKKYQKILQTYKKNFYKHTKKIYTDKKKITESQRKETHFDNQDESWFDSSFKSMSKFVSMISDGCSKL